MPPRTESCPARWTATAIQPTLVATRIDRDVEEALEVYEDRTLTCRDCGDDFGFTAGEQQFFAAKGLLNDPQRCPQCRAAARQARTAGGPRLYHAAICASCGDQAVIPFAPRPGRPVYCSSCFDKVRAQSQGTHVSA